MFNWYRELLEIRYEFRERKLLIEQHHCQSCEVLKSEIERLRQENTRLLDKIILKPEHIDDGPKELTAELPKRPLSWSAKRQILEAEDRERARLISRAPIPITELEDMIVGGDRQKGRE